jgi:hypothetical protein
MDVRYRSSEKSIRYPWPYSRPPPGAALSPRLAYARLGNSGGGRVGAGFTVIPSLGPFTEFMQYDLGLAQAAGCRAAKVSSLLKAGKSNPPPGLRKEDDMYGSRHCGPVRSYWLGQRPSQRRARADACNFSDPRARLRIPPLSRIRDSQLCVRVTESCDKTPTTCFNGHRPSNPSKRLVPYEVL